MKVILLEDVKALGKKGQIVNVNDGYARNFILPKKLGVEANNKNLNDLKLKKANDEKIAQEQLEEAQELGKKIEAGKVELAIKVGEGGRTFGSVSTKEIAAAVKEQMGYDIISFFVCFPLNKSKSYPCIFSIRRAVSSVSFFRELTIAVF